MTPPPKKHIDSLLLASHNPGKIAELERMLAPLGISVTSAADLDLPEVVENKGTFRGNAEKKAAEIAAATGLPTLADDSGLCVDALGGNPGVFTKRYGTYERLLKDMDTTPKGGRNAFFVCVLALAIPGQNTVFFEGNVSGTITPEPRGNGGFDYDPVFIPHGHNLTFAEMPVQEKQQYSHRGAALAKFKEHLREHLIQYV